MTTLMSPVDSSDGYASTSIDGVSDIGENMSNSISSQHPLYNHPASQVQVPASSSNASSVSPTGTGVNTNTGMGMPSLVSRRSSSPPRSSTDGGHRDSKERERERDIRDGRDTESVTSGHGRSSTSRWRESSEERERVLGLPEVPLERRDTAVSSVLSTGGGGEFTVVEPSFDESVLRALCDLDCGVPLLLDRIKQSMVSCREASVFFKKRAVLEEEYGRGMHKLAKVTAEVYAMNDGKAGSFVGSWQATMKIHEVMADNRIRFAQRLNEMSEELANLAKEVDKNRKSTKELATRYERSLQESELLTEKSKARFDVSIEELERILLQKEGESPKDNIQGRSPGGKRAIGKAAAKGALLLKGKNPGNLQRQEDECRQRVSTASDVYKRTVQETQKLRQEYFNFQLPRILRALKECADEIDLGTQYHLTRYAFLFESIMLSDGSTLAPGAADEGMGLKATIESIDNRSDFKVYMQNYSFAHANTYRGPRRTGPEHEGFLPPLPHHVDRTQAHPPPLLIPPSTSTSTSPNNINNPYPNALNASTSYGNPNSNPSFNSTNLTTANHNNNNNPAAATTTSLNNNNNIPAARNGSDRGRPTFGVDLAEQMMRDNVEVPLIVEKCCGAIEKYGLWSQGIYRLSGTTSKVAKLKERLDRDLDAVNLDAEEWSSDINNVTSVLKLWLRELPEPVMTTVLHQHFIDAARIENPRLRHIRLHEHVNDLPDPNYATLKYFLGHLQRISQFSEQNSMTISNLSIVFGPTLFSQGISNGAQNGITLDPTMQNKAIETILEHYTDIFIDESEA